MSKTRCCVGVVLILKVSRSLHEDARVSSFKAHYTMLLEASGSSVSTSKCCFGARWFWRGDFVKLVDVLVFALGDMANAESKPETLNATVFDTLNVLRHGT